MVRELMLPTQVENLEQVMNFVDCFLEELNCPMHVQFELDIAVEELFVNVAHYAYESEEGQITIQAEYLDNVVTIVFIDSGKPYNPWAKEDPDITLCAEERQIGGLGIYMVKKSMDETAYRYEDGRNIVTIKKDIKVTICSQ